MKKKALRKDFFVEIKKTFSRFISIFFIVALGVAFFTGIRSSKPDMKLSADEFYDQSSLMDIRVMGTLGLTEEDAAMLSETKGVEGAEGAYGADMLWGKEDVQLVIKVMSLPEDINKIVVKEGRKPETPEECIVDTQFMDHTDMKIGDQITLRSGTEDKLTDTLKYETYTITGTCVTSYYMGITRGNSSIGTGEISSFIMVPRESFALETFTEIYLKVAGAEELTSYTEDYDNLVEDTADRIEAEVKDLRIKARYEEVIGKATDKVNEAKEELATEQIKANAELKDAKKKLDDAKKELEDGKIEISDNEKVLEDGRKKLQQSKQDIVKGKNDLIAGKTKLNESKDILAKGEEKYQAGYDLYLANKQELEAGRKEIEAAKEQIAMIPDEEQKGAATAALKEKEFIIAAGEKELVKAEFTLRASREQLETGKKEIQAGEQELAKAERTIKNGEAEITKAERDIPEGEKKLANAKQDVEDGEIKLKSATKEYKEGKEEADSKIADAQKEIEKAEKEIKKIKKPKWYVLDRNSLQTYVEYSQDADRIGAIGDVFPVIFFLVAALVSLTTMTRMVEEERMQIGTLKALGYNKFSIAGKYLMYALLATLGGSILGGLAGGKYLPYVVIHAYQIIYRYLEVIVTPINWYYLILASGLAVFCVLAATLAACYKELSAPPAELMRPAPPKQGKRVMLERIGPIWKRLSFTWKSTVRNLVRYKKRFLMTIFGISGCMALLLVGFGIKDSIFSIVTLQFGQIFKYDVIAMLDEDATESEMEGLSEYISNSDRILGTELVMSKTLEAGAGNIEKSAALTVFQDQEDMEDYVVLRERKSHKKLMGDEEGAIITEKLASLLNITEGDTIYLKDEELSKVEVKVTGITENYVQHFIYLTPALYEKIYGEKAVMNQMYFIDKDNSPESQSILSEELLKNDGVLSVNFLSTAQARFDEMLDSLDVVILILTLSAGGLAFVVLYNLNNINITERVRELATIKVLGFYDIEVSEYVFRENVALTVIGAIFGVIFGALLHRFVILTVEVDMTMFGRNINLLSYIKSVAITFVFAALINFTMHFKLKKIDMASSLKSVE